MAKTGDGYDVSPEAVGKSTTRGSDTPGGFGKWVGMNWAIFGVVLVGLAIALIVILYFVATN